MIRCLLFAATLALHAGVAGGQPFPTRSIEIVIPYAVSGPTDIRGTSRLTKMYKLIAQNAPPPISDRLARIAADAIESGTEHTVKLDRQPGGATTRGATSVARAKADGHTLLLGSDTTLLVSPHYYVGVKYDGMRDFVLVAPLVTMPFVLMTNVSLPVDNVRDLIEWLKVRPGEVNYGSSGDGSTGHLAGERFRRMTGLDVVHVSYNGGLSALNAVATNHVSYMFAALPLALPYFANEYVRPLAITTAQRLPRLPDLPTLAEAGVGDYAVEGWYGIFSGRRTPAKAVGWLGEHIGAAMDNERTQRELRALGLEPVTTERAQFATRINTEADEVAAFVRKMRAPPDGRP